MKNLRISNPRRVIPAESGVVLIIALIVLVALTLAAIALVRSVDTSNIIAGNLAFQQGATRSADAGVEAAIAWLEDCNTTHVHCAAGTLDGNSAKNGYSANGSDSTRSPTAGMSWDVFWSKNLANTDNTVRLPQDSAGNVVEYIIDRMCNTTGVKGTSASCVASPAVSSTAGNEEESGVPPLNAPSVVYYRITVRVTGPRNTSSYVQAMVSM